jgi:hypothetical protein
MARRLALGGVFEEWEKFKPLRHMEFPVFVPDSREFAPEQGSHMTAPTAKSTRKVLILLVLDSWPDASPTFLPLFG